VTGSGGSQTGPSVLEPWSEDAVGFEECIAETQIPDPHNAVLMFVVDVGGSMT
jgi:hypothetical protein